MREYLVGVPTFSRRTMVVLTIGLLVTMQLLGQAPARAAAPASAVRAGHYVRNTLLPVRSRSARNRMLLADKPGDSAQPSLPAARDASLPPFPPGYAQSANVIQINPATEYSVTSQSSDSTTGWGDDVWQFSLSNMEQISVEVDDCCLVGDNYEVYVTRNLSQTEDQIGVTPTEDISGTTNSSGVFTRLIGPGVHYVAIRDPGGVYWYNQGNTNFFPAAYNVDIKFTTTGPGGASLVTHPIIFVHGINTSSSNPGFGPVLGGLRQLYGASQVQNFAYVDDQSLNDPSVCRQYTPDGCVSQSAVLPNAMKLAAMVKQTAAGGRGHKVTLIGYSQGAAIIRTMLEGCMSEVPSASTPGCGGIPPLIDNVFFINGVQQGSWVDASDTNITAIAQQQGISDVSALDFMLLLKGPTEFFLRYGSGHPLYPNDPAEVDLAPKSANIQTHNSVAPPNGIHYFNFYGDIRIQQQTQDLIWNISAAQTISIGDLVVLTGSDDPKGTPLSGGARFCLQCTDRGGFSFAAIDANTTYTEWPLTDTIKWNPDVLYNYLPGPVTNIADDLLLLAVIHAAPEMHTTIPSDAALNSIMVRDTTGLAGQVTIPTEIMLQLEQEDGIEP